MTRNDRPRKTLARKLRDLDDHLHFLNEALQKLHAGDFAYLKQIAAELRVLVCMASRTEGLLWRLIEELKLCDAVHVHLAGNLDRAHSLADSLQFIFAPVLPAGKGAPRFTPRYYSLKAIIKEHEVLVVSGKGYSHESLIRAVAEQMGSAHEDDGAAPHLIELSNILVSNRPALVSVLSSDAELVLDVGNRALSKADGKYDFVRSKRIPLVSPAPTNAFQPRAPTEDFEISASQLPVSGTVMFLVNHEHSDWQENASGYDFGTFVQGELKVRAIKHSDRTIQISVAGVGGSVLETRKPIPPTNQPGVMIGFTWNGSEFVFYLCGERVDSLVYCA